MLAFTSATFLKSRCGPSQARPKTKTSLFRGRVDPLRHKAVFFLASGLAQKVKVMGQILLLLYNTIHTVGVIQTGQVFTKKHKKKQA